MKTTLLFAICLAMASAATAGEVFGTITENGKAVPQGTPVKLECGGASAAGATDQYGSYSIKTSATGDCRLILTYKGSSPGLNVTLFEKPSRYDLVVSEEAGKVILARK